MGVLGEVIGESAAIGAVRDQLARLLARGGDGRRLPPVLLQGETGTGKGLVARGIHRASSRRDAPFVDVNCAAIPDTLLESEMFGFERGAFTDARQAKPGLFQTAHRGTLFLDEVGLLPEALQAKLLNVIEERTVRRLGATRSEAVDVWIVCGTNEDLVAAVRARRFREDLYHRLAVVTVSLPPLRDRGADVVHLAEHFLARACRDYGLPGKTLGADARAALAAHSWPGNVRELGNVMERVALLAEAEQVTAAMLGLPAGSLAVGATTADDAGDRDADPATAGERQALLDALRVANGNVSRAAARLGISRNTIRYRLEKHGVRQDGTPSRGRRATASSPRTPPATPPPAPDVLGPAVPLRWERRRVTLLRAEIVPFTSEHRPADLGRPLPAIVEKVQAFGGRIEELAATRVVAAFGVEPVEDAPRRAANAALAIRKAAERARAGDEEPWAVKLAIHAQEVTVGRMTGATVLDDASRQEAWTALASLAADAAADDVVVSEALTSVLERRFDVAPVGRGRAFRVAGREHSSLGPSAGMAAFVGRRGELDLLLARFQSAASGQGQAVTLVGDAGIGKSRLLYELRQAASAGPAVVVEGHCLSYGSGIPYLPVLEMVRTLFALADADTPETIAAKLETGLRVLGVGGVEATGDLLRLLGVKEDGVAHSAEAFKARTLETLRQLWLTQARQRPLLLMVEDLHWIDRASEEFFASLADVLSGAAILLVSTARPGYRAPWTDKSYATQVALAPLPADEAASIVRGMLGDHGVDAMGIDTILAKAEGNPFYLEEIARVVRGRGALAELPDTIQDVVRARIDRLPDPARDVLQTAAVLGRKFSARVLRGMRGDAADPVDLLRDLTRQEFLYEQSVGDETLYVFKHAVTHEVAYATPLDAHRRQLHAAAGHEVERMHAGRIDEVVELLAHHFGSSDDDARAVDYAILAAEKAQRRSANQEALVYFEAAQLRLQRMPDDAANRLRRIDAVVKQAEVKFALGRHAEHVQTLESIRGLIEQVDDPLRHATWLYWTGFLHSLTGSRPEVAIGYCRAAAVIAEEHGFEEVQGYVQCCLAQAHVIGGDLAEAVDAGERALAIFGARGNVWWSCRALWHLASAANAKGEWSRGLDYSRRALQYGHAVDDRRLKVVASWRIGSTHILSGDVARGIERCDEALALAPLPIDEAMTKAVRGHGLARAGHVVAGTTEQEEALAWLARYNLRYTASVFSLNLAEDYLRGGDTRRAMDLVDNVLAIARDAHYQHLEAVALRLRGECHAAREPAQAIADLDSAIARLASIGARNELGKALVARAGLDAATDAEGARARLEEALAIFDALETSDEPARVRGLLATL